LIERPDPGKTGRAFFMSEPASRQPGYDFIDFLTGYDSRFAS
jgi:hypothetical protein